MAMSAVLKVDVNVVLKKIDSFKAKRTTLLKVMQRIREIMVALAATSWISPASAALLKQFMQLYKQIEESFRIVEEYIHDLEIVTEQYTKIEERLSDKASSLRTDIFGV